MSNTLNKLFDKGKAKLKEYSTPSNSSHSGYPGQGYQGQSYPNQQQSYPGASYSGQPYPPWPYNNAPPPHQYQYQNHSTAAPYSPYAPQPPQWGAPPNQWGPPQPQPLSPPPVNLASKPQTPQPPPVPGNRPRSEVPPLYPPHNTVYWQASFDQSVPVTQNFRHELGAHGWGNNESQNYIASPQNSFHTADGRLVVRAISQNGSYTSARLTSHQTLARPRGYLTATLLPPSAEGIWPAFWMLPKDPFQWPVDGEIDICESWNGLCVNHSCLHWGNYDGQDWDKHRVVETAIPTLSQQAHSFGVAWIEEEGIPNWRGRLIWSIDGKPVMRANIPLGTRRMEDFRILINIAMGGTVCGGKLPRDGSYDLVVSDLKMYEEPIGGWNEFDRAWESTREGKPQ